MRILGLSLGDTSTAAAMVGNRVVACVSEERFSRVKRDESYPRRAIEYCLKAAGVRGDQLDAVVIGGVDWDFWRWLTHYHSLFSIEELMREQEEYWYPIRYERKKVAWPRLFQDKWDLKQYPGTWTALVDQLGADLHLTREGHASVNRFLDGVIASHLGIDKERILRVDQHTALGAYAYWASGLRGKGTGVIVLDAGREGIGASVAAPLGFGLMRLCAISSSEFRIGRLMRDVTLMLGLPPRDHDPAIMGLAAHAPTSRWRAAYRVFKNSIKVSGLEFENADTMADTYFHFLDKLRRLPDEAVAGGVQRFAEDVLTEWVANVVRCNRMPRLAVTGSLSMNHRIMAKIAELPAVEELSVLPAAGDGALAIGACLHQSTIRFGMAPAALTDCYLGPDISTRDVEAGIKTLRASGNDYDLRANPSADEIAELLARGAIIGRCVGRAEFGSRGLGNRSILVDPRNARVVPVIAAKIKRRDAYVPFSPTILAERASRYIKNEKGISSPFMTLAFPVRPSAYADLAAAIDHDAGTVRPQVLGESANRDFWKLIRAFERTTGVGALLNTSLNAHGEPMVLTAQDAVRMFRDSGLDFLLLGNILVGKQRMSLRRRRPSSARSAGAA